MYDISRLTEDHATFLTSALIYEDLVNVPTARRSSQKRGKINHQPAFAQGRKLQQHSRKISENPPQHYYYDIYHHKTPQENYLGVTGECFHDVKRLTITSDQQEDLARTFQDVTMQKRSTSAYLTNQDLYRSHDAFLNSLPLERRYLRSAQATQFIPWNSSNQALRLSKEWTEKLESRANKRTSQVLGHRVDKLYMMNGNAVKLQPKYDVSDEEILHLKQLAKAREEVRAETRQSKNLILIPESEDSGEGLSQGDDRTEEMVGGEVSISSPMPETLQTGESVVKEPTSLSMRADSPESGFQGEDQLSSIMGGVQDSVPCDPPAARPPSVADVTDNKSVQVLNLESAKPNNPNQEPEMESDTHMTPNHNATTGVTVSDILSHRSPSPLKSVRSDLDTVSNIESEVPTNTAPQGADNSVVEEEEELTQRKEVRSLCLLPGDGCYSLMPDKAEGYNNTKTWCADYTSYPYRKMGRWNIRFSGKFPVRKPNMKFSAPTLCECECRKTSVFLSLQGVNVPTICKH